MGFYSLFSEGYSIISCLRYFHDVAKNVNFWEILKALICVFPLSLSIFLLVPLLSGPLVVHKTRISLVSTLLQRPIELATISFSGAALHYLLPILNPIVNVNVDQQPLTVRDPKSYSNDMTISALFGIFRIIFWPVFLLQFG